MTINNELKYKISCYQVKVIVIERIKVKTGEIQQDFLNNLTQISY